ncbi:MAG TPA: hypothetical protein VJV75_03935, partial [Candidatus Polarisedimenticolia bacterium]|nr:hypothetical protein [Candidatus Polarisedimenticolia bacterium]
MAARQSASGRRVVAALTLLLTPAVSAPIGAADTAPVPVPLIETSRSELVLIEVYARDTKGNPVRDLTIGDFVL